MVPVATSAETDWDVFISHASSDKPVFVLPLAEGLRSRGVRVWLDNWAIEIGDSLVQSISEGLKRSRYGVVVLSPAFFARMWPKRELETLFAKETAGSRLIIPIWHHVTYDDVWNHAPLLVDRAAAKSEDGIPNIVDRICRLLRIERGNESSITAEAVARLTKQLFPNLPLDFFWQEQLLADLDRSIYRSITDIELGYKRAARAVEAFATEQPALFRSGTDYLTKALGFVDLCFRSRHSWAAETLRAFQQHANKIDWNLK